MIHSSSVGTEDDLPADGFNALSSLDVADVSATLQRRGLLFFFLL